MWIRGDINDKFLQLKRGLANALFYGSWISFLQNKHTLKTYLSNYYALIALVQRFKTPIRFKPSFPYDSYV